MKPSLFEIMRQDSDSVLTLGTTSTDSLFVVLKPVLWRGVEYRWSKLLRQVTVGLLGLEQGRIHQGRNEERSVAQDGDKIYLPGS